VENSGPADSLSSMLEWSEPVVFDCLRESYCARVGDGAPAWEFARQHCRCWRALIAGEMDEFETLRRELSAALQSAGFEPACAAHADARTLTELHEIVTARFQRSPRLATGYRLALIALAARLAPRRGAA